MGAVAPDTKWSIPDDLLLKNAVEAGATLESVSKGAVRFSQRYTLQELQDRWLSLLYDPIVSVKTSALMFEHERSSSMEQPKLGKSDGTNTGSILRKRKAESIRTRYYTMRKMVSSVSQGVDTLDMSLLATLPDYGCPDSTFEGSTHACPDNFCGGLPTIADDVTGTPSIFVNDGLSLDPGALGHSTLFALGENVLSTRDHCMTENYVQPNELPVADLHKSECLEVKQPTLLNQVTDSEVPITDCETELHDLGYEIPLSPAADWHAMEEISTPTLPAVDYGGNEDYINDTFRSSLDVDNCDTLGSIVMQKNDNLNEQMQYLGPETETAGIIAQLNQFLDCTDPDDFPDTVDEFYMDTFSNLLIDYTNVDEAATCPSVASIATEGYHDLANGQIDGEFRDKNSTHSRIDRGIAYSPERKEKLLSSARSVNPAFPESRNGVTCCRLNTEDNVVPDNDDVFLPVCMPTLTHSCLADWEFDKARNPVSSSIMDIPTHQRASRGGPLMMKNKQSDNENPLLSSHRMSSSFPTHQRVKSEGDLMRKKEQRDNKQSHIPSLAMSSSFRNHDKTTHGGCPMMEREQIDSNRAQIMSSSVPTLQDITHRPVLVVKGEENDQTHIMSSSLQQIMSSNHEANVHADNSKNDHINQLKCTHENEKDSRDLYIQEKVIYVDQNNHHVGSAHESQVNMHNQLSSVAELNNENSAMLHNGAFSNEELDTTEVFAAELEKDLELFGIEECPDDDDVPYSSDVEAMILDMDFSPNDEDSDPCETVVRHPNEKLIKTMLRLEQAARASSHRMMQAYGAFAVLYSNHTRHLIKKPEVLLGRTSEDIQVDIDLSTKQCRNKVSRQQATIKVNDDGAFTLKNLGKASIYVNGRLVSTSQSQYLTSSCLIEIRKAAFLFEINPARVKRYIEEEIGRGSRMLNIEEEIRRANKMPKEEPLALE